MLAAIAEIPGPIDTVVIRDVPELGELRAGEVVVRMLVSTFNPSDAVTVSGAYASRTAFPLVPGFEGVGIIDRIGPGVPTSALGQRVLPIGSPGAWQECKRIDHSWCIPVPDDIPTDVACFAYINPLTASLMVECFCHGVHSVLIDAATTTIAGHLKTLLEQWGIETVTVGRTWGTVGVDKQFDVAFDCVGGEMGRRVARAVKPDGVVVHYGLLSGEPLGETGRRVEMFRLRDVVHACPRSELPELFADVFSQLRVGRLRSLVAREVDLGDVPAVLREYQPREGKLLIRIGH